MGITLNPSPSQISKLYSGRFATPEEKAAREAAKAQEPEDKIEISQEGRNAILEAPPQDGETGWEEQMEKIDA